MDEKGFLLQNVADRFSKYGRTSTSILFAALALMVTRPDYGTNLKSLSYLQSAAAAVLIIWHTADADTPSSGAVRAYDKPISNTSVTISRF